MVTWLSAVLLVFFLEGNVFTPVLTAPSRVWDVFVLKLFPPFLWRCSLLYWALL